MADDGQPSHDDPMTDGFHEDHFPDFEEMGEEAVLRLLPSGKFTEARFNAAVVWLGRRNQKRSEREREDRAANLETASAAKRVASAAERQADAASKALRVAKFANMIAIAAAIMAALAIIRSFMGHS